MHSQIDLLTYIEASLQANMYLSFNMFTKQHIFLNHLESTVLLMCLLLQHSMRICKSLKSLSLLMGLVSDSSEKAWTLRQTQIPGDILLFL